MSNRPRRRARRAATALTAVLTLAGCGTYADTASDTVAAQETGSVLIPESRVVENECIPTGTNTRIGYGDTAYYYPAGRRTYEFSNEPGADHEPFRVPTADNQVVTVSGVLAFRLKTDCETLNRFHQDQGRKDWGGRPAFIGSTDSSLFPEGTDPFAGWAAMLDTDLGGPLQTGLNAAGVTHATLPLYTREEERANYAAAVREGLPALITGTAGGDYFALEELRITEVLPPQETLDALNRQANAINLQNAITQENLAAEKQYDGVNTCKNKGISEQSCVVLYGINSGKVPFLTPDGGTAVLQAPPK